MNAKKLFQSISGEDFGGAAGFEPVYTAHQMRSKMPIGVLQTIGLWLLLASDIATLDCDLIVQYQTKEIGETMGLLEAMEGRQSPQKCPGDPDFGFPMVKIRTCSKEDVRMAVGLILESILIVFQHNFTQAQWNATATELFQRALDQQCITWRKCSTAEITFKDFCVKLALKKYFRKLHTFLKDRQYSLCAWKRVRDEVSVIYPIVLNELMKRLDK
ncbi:interferon alpha-13-like [Sceloporus undulatus]|uniref:interferon alpha-13-like n=1 Tax=Sceloporus undulatus TaxID=8520 RepID=UPI001C4B18D3|nr:interferon alpha-13-like [Sceloporus undulatus]